MRIWHLARRWFSEHNELTFGGPGHGPACSTRRHRPRTHPAARLVHPLTHRPVIRPVTTRSPQTSMGSAQWAGNWAGPPIHAPAGPLLRQGPSAVARSQQTTRTDSGAGLPSTTQGRRTAGAFAHRGTGQPPVGGSGNRLRHGTRMNSNRQEEQSPTHRTRPSAPTQAAIEAKSEHQPTTRSTE